MGLGIQRKKFIYSSAIAAVIALSGCGEKKEVRGTPPPEAPKSTTTVETEGNPGGGVAVPSAESDPSIPIPAPSESVEVTSVKDPLDAGSGYEPVGEGAVERTDFDKRYTGMEDVDGLFYTGSSTDKLLTYLRLRNDDPNLDSGVKIRNLEAARSIRSAHLSHDEDTGDVIITLKIKEGQYLKDYVLVGGINEGDSVSKLRLATGRRGVKTTGQQDISGKIKCMDEDGGCETIFARLVIEEVPEPVPLSVGGSTGARAAVAILFRQSLADIRASLTKSSGNPEYDDMRDFWINSHYEDTRTDMRLKKAVIKSYEIVNGRSGFETQIIGENRQLISLGGPLLAPEVGTSVEITANRNAEMKESADLDGIASYKHDLANFIGSAKIINNNGLGQVRIALKMRKRVGYSQEAFRLTIMRIIKPTLEPNEENLNLK